MQKNKLLCLHFDRFWHWKPCYYIYWTLFSAHCLCYIHIDTASSACALCLLTSIENSIQSICSIKKEKVSSAKIYTNHLFPHELFSLLYCNMFRRRTATCFLSPMIFFIAGNYTSIQATFDMLMIISQLH